MAIARAFGFLSEDRLSDSYITDSEETAHGSREDKPELEAIARRQRTAMGLVSTGF